MTMVDIRENEVISHKASLEVAIDLMEEIDKYKCSIEGVEFSLEELKRWKEFLDKEKEMRNERPD